MDASHAIRVMKKDLKMENACCSVVKEEATKQTTDALEAAACYLGARAELALGAQAD
jgi:hypothetical protein